MIKNIFIFVLLAFAIVFLSLFIKEKNASPVVITQTEVKEVQTYKNEAPTKVAETETVIQVEYADAAINPETRTGEYAYLVGSFIGGDGSSYVILDYVQAKERELYPGYDYVNENSRLRVHEVASGAKLSSLSNAQKSVSTLNGIEEFITQNSSSNFQYPVLFDVDSGVITMMSVPYIS